MTNSKKIERRSAITEILQTNPQGLTREELYTLTCARLEVNENTFSSTLNRMVADGELALDSSQPRHHRFFAATDDNPLSDGVIQRTVPAKARKCKLTTRYSPMGWCVAVLTGAVA